MQNSVEVPVYRPGRLWLVNTGHEDHDGYIMPMAEVFGQETMECAWCLME
jgi:hypothetical protein